MSPTEGPAVQDPFSTSVPNLQTAWDSVSMTTFMECPRKYQLSILKGWMKEKRNIHLEFGIALHDALDTYFTAVLTMSKEEAVIKTVRKILSINLPLDDTNYKTPFTLARSFVWYIDHFRNEALQTIILPNGEAATELSFRIPLELVTPDGDNYIYCGHIDRGVHYAKEEGETFVTDYKTTKYTLSSNYFKEFSTSWQITGYIFAGQVMFANNTSKALIDAFQILVNSTRFERRITQRDNDQISEWMRDFLHNITLAEDCAHEDYWPMNRTACGNYGGCDFREVCGKSPMVREEYLKEDYIVRKWNPLENR